ncbi:uncharacterized protein F5147DRAFT_654491 [Suillus discolor]|uniref:Uncharacterized protein n=1 Tax=Suillus discolor TaxID=1912936 RepID=A0A9P7F4A3_9AGAM|nr:uncharacterized protein F5147DRAFT_654491 [Suillus discolor]KAG2104412.1 hypothetical protein F5147DRAFT_654491 [Suillus discolor]
MDLFICFGVHFFCYDDGLDGRNIARHLSGILSPDTGRVNLEQVRVANISMGSRLPIGQAKKHRSQQLHTGCVHIYHGEAKTECTILDLINLYVYYLMTGAVCSCVSSVRTHTLYSVDVLRRALGNFIIQTYALWGQNRRISYILSGIYLLICAEGTLAGAFDCLALYCVAMRSYSQKPLIAGSCRPLGTYVHFTSNDVHDAIT